MSRDFREIVETISGSLDVEPTPLVPLQVEIKEIRDDHRFARENIHKMIQQTSIAVERLTEVAVYSQDPEAFDALSKLVQTLANANEQLIRINETQQKIEQRATGNDPKTINNNVFLTTADLQKLIQGSRNGN
jgi:hypothetical protein